jgi:formylglycine-generating enzyme required for sulfatase activity
MIHHRTVAAAALAALVLCIGAPTFAQTPVPESADMLTIPAGQFIMGSSQAETDHEQTQTMHTEGDADNFGPREKPQHEVQIKSFKLSKYLVTRGDFAQFVNLTGYAAVGCYGYNGVHYAQSATQDWRWPGFKQTNRDPAVCVSYKDALAYIAWYSERTGLAYRLPSEAEIEYATRAGTTTSRFWGEDVALQCAYGNGPDLTMKEHFPGWYGAPCHDGYMLTSPVGAFKPNPWGLYDMLGEVYQLTADCWHENYSGAPTDGSAWTSGDCSQRAVHGGSTTSHPGSMRSAARTATKADTRTVYVGFRIARSAP